MEHELGGEKAAARQGYHAARRTHYSVKKDIGLMESHLFWVVP